MTSEDAAPVSLRGVVALRFREPIEERSLDAAPA
jgi:hypothetical protein